MALDLNEVAQSFLRANTNIDNVFNKFYDMYYNPTPMDITVPYVNPDGSITDVTIPNKAKVINDFQTWKQDFQGTLPEAFAYPELEIFVSPSGSGDGTTAETPTDIITALNLIPKISKYAFCSISLLDGTYDLSTLDIRIPHLTNYFRFKKSDAATTTPVVNLNSIEIWGASRFSISGIHIIITSDNFYALSVRESASMFIYDSIIESTTAVNTVGVYSGGILSTVNSTFNNNNVTDGVGIYVSRGEAKIDTAEIQNASIGLNVVYGGRVWRASVTYTNCTITENVDTDSVLQP